MAGRETIKVAGLGHGRNPVPIAVRMGPFVFTGSIMGQDPETGAFPESVAEQVVNAFDNVRRVMAAAGGTSSDIAKMVIHLKEYDARDAVNSEWVKMFPDEDDRPVRHILPSASPTNPGVQLEVTAVL